MYIELSRFARTLVKRRAGLADDSHLRYAIIALVLPRQRDVHARSGETPLRSLFGPSPSVRRTSLLRVQLYNACTPEYRGDENAHTSARTHHPACLHAKLGREVHHDIIRCPLLSAPATIRSARNGHRLVTVRRGNKLRCAQIACYWLRKQARSQNGVNGRLERLAALPALLCSALLSSALLCSSWLFFLCVQ